MPNSTPKTCAVCGKSFPFRKVYPLGAVRPSVLQEIESDQGPLDPRGFICYQDLADFRMRYSQNLLVREKGELSGLEEGVVESLKRQELMATGVHLEFEGKLTLGQRLADRIAVFGGSWTFLLTFFGFLLIWIIINTIFLLARPFDPYPFILLNLLLSCLAAIQAPVIMMSQNRQEAKDRARAEHDYQINLKAELETVQNCLPTKRSTGANFSDSCANTNAPERSIRPLRHRRDPPRYPRARRNTRMTI